MDLNEFIEKFAEAIELDDASGLTAETEFRNLAEWSSLSALSIIAMADEEYDVELSGKELREAKTIGDLLNTIQNKSK